MILKGVLHKWDDVVSIRPVQERDQWQAVVN
jgi:hypothetical protein